MLKKVFNYLLLLVAFFGLESCYKKIIPEDNLNNGSGVICDSIANLKIRGVKSFYYIGEPISLSVSNVPDIFYSWYDNKSRYISSSTTFNLSSCTKENQGWIYATASNNNCTSNHDSVYLNIKNVPVTPICSPTNNVIQFSSLPNLTFSDTYWKFDAVSNRMNLSGSSGSFGVYFNPYWNTIEPEDGVYDITNSISFNDAFSVYSVFISTISQSVYYSSNKVSEKVYVTHQNGKIQLTICDVTLTGDFGGTIVQSKIIGKITAP
jgi:hypothetical protein